MLSSKEYIFKNPVGWLIDTIEEQLPTRPEVLAEIAKARQEIAS